MIPMISFIGSSGSGKTTVLEKVVTALKERGIKVAVIKHSPHKELDFDKGGKDSQRYASAGAETVVISGPQEIVFMEKTDHDLSPIEIACFINPNIDLILTEGFKNALCLKIEVHKKELGSELLSKPEQLLAVITDEPLDIKVPQFDLTQNNTAEIADFIVRFIYIQLETEIKASCQFNVRDNKWLKN